jgi:hypothetical protein
MAGFRRACWAVVRGRVLVSALGNDSTDEKAEVLSGMITTFLGKVVVVIGDDKLVLCRLHINLAVLLRRHNT